jgi:SIR2-like protein
MSSPETLPDNKGWNLLRSHYRKRGLVLALGAGVSKGCRLPSWEQLLGRMGDACLGEGKGRKLVKHLIDSRYGLPAIAGILDSERPRKQSLVNLIRDALYEDFPFHEAAHTSRKRDALIQFVQENNSTLRAVVSLCTEKRNGEYLPNPQIVGVVNFNVDSVLRNYARAKSYPKWIFRTIEHPSDNRSRSRIQIYQMHGFVSYTRRQPEGDDTLQQCVFTEQEYFDFFNKPHSLFNYTFLYLLREYHCLFIGMSMLDDNIRRLLHYSTKERREYMDAPEKSGRAADNRALRHFAIMKRSDSHGLDDLVEASLRRLGTRGLWLDDYDEIPERLGFVYENQDQHWGDVY